MSSVTMYRSHQEAVASGEPDQKYNLNSTCRSSQSNALDQLNSCKRLPPNLGKLTAVLHNIQGSADVSDPS